MSYASPDRGPRTPFRDLTVSPSSFGQQVGVDGPLGISRHVHARTDAVPPRRRFRPGISVSTFDEAFATYSATRGRCSLRLASARPTMWCQARLQGQMSGDYERRTALALDESRGTA
ncbi:hypothetical protein D9M68_279170 [compost metagenome]